MRTATKEQQEAINLYAAILEEARIRLSSITAATGDSTGLPTQLAMEYCYLQLRMLCELIALGCLTAHGDITGAKSPKLQKEWSADKIMGGLEALNPNFYPHPVQLTSDPGRLHIDRLTSGFLTKGELIRLYGKCGDRLHRGTLKKLIGQKVVHTAAYDEVITWTNKIVVLLKEHHIASIDNLTHFICQLAAGGHARVALALSPLPSP